jgi:hypothetical protein
LTLLTALTSVAASNSSTLAINIQTRIFALIIIAWMVIHVILLYHFGIRTDGEAVKYIREANNLLTQNKLSSPNFWMYITQILLILVSVKLRVGYEFVIGVQLFFSLLATLSFYRLTTHLFNNKIGFFATMWLLAILPIHQFNTFLQTDSLFYSFTIIYSSYLLRVASLSLKTTAILLLGLIIISITRPTGLFFFAATFLYLYFTFLPRIKLTYTLAIPVLIAIIFIYFLNTAIGSGGELDFMAPARDESIICGIPTLPDFRRIRESGNGNSLYGLLYYIAHNFPQFLRLAFYRSIAFFGLLRPYYSTIHKIYLLVLFLPVYLMVIISIRYWIKQNPFIIVYILTLIFLTWVTVILSCDDWHNRFFLTISPYLIIMALPGINKWMFRNIS